MLRRQGNALIPMGIFIRKEAYSQGQNDRLSAYFQPRIINFPMRGELILDKVLSTFTNFLEQHSLLMQSLTA